MFDFSTFQFEIRYNPLSLPRIRFIFDAAAGPVYDPIKHASLLAVLSSRPQMLAEVFVERGALFVRDGM